MAEFNWQKKFPSMVPVKSAPPLFRFNGCGVSIYGERDRDAETRTHVTTLCLALLFIPVFALRAYRVAKAPKGWYFIGREPLSMFAKLWNVGLIASILLTIGIVQYVDYTSSPAYIAKGQMAEAHSLVSKGKLAEGAKIYAKLALAGADEADNATDATKDLIDNRCPAAPLSESPGVYASAVQVARRGNKIPAADLVDSGLKLVNDKANADPKDGVAVLDLIRPLVIDTRAIDERRLELLRKWSAQEPANLDVINPLAALLEQQNQLDQAQKLLMPLKAQLGDGEGARVLGTILARQGDFDGSYNLLWPYVKNRLDKLHEAEANSQHTLKSLWDREIKVLDDHKGPQDFYEKYQAAGSDQQHAMVREYVNAQIKNDPEYTSSQDTLERESAVVPVALELGIVMLQRAQGQTDAAVRKSQLESAEQVFLAIGGIAGESDEYRLSLGQVYYWLGKQTDGRKLFDDFLTSKTRSFESLLEVAGRMRSLGADSEARAMAEEAYNSTSKTDERYSAASFRALCCKDLDDQILWMNKGDPNDAASRASLAKANGQKAYELGHDDEAVKQYHICIDAYAAMPRNDTTLNETALAYYGIFSVTGERASMDKCIDYFQQAVDLNPSDTILLYNAGETLTEGAITDLIGSDIDLHALRLSGTLDMLSYLYNDRAGRDVVVAKMKAHPGIARGLSYLEKVTVLSPKNVSAFSAVYGLRAFMRDETVLASLAERAKAADLDTGNEVSSLLDYLNGNNDEKNRAALAVALKRSQDQIDALRAKGGRTASVAIALMANQIVSQYVSGDNADLDKSVALAEEAYKINPCSGTVGTMISAHLYHATDAMRKADPAFEAYFAKYVRSVGVRDLVALIESQPGPFQQKVTQNPEIAATVALMQKQNLGYPNECPTNLWAITKNTNSADADKKAQTIRSDHLLLLEQAMNQMLAPGDATGALDQYWLMQILGKPGDGAGAIKRVADLGVPIPTLP